jgi:hypothetical protein
VILLDPRSTSEFNTHEKHQPPRRAVGGAPRFGLTLSALAGRQGAPR